MSEEERTDRKEERDLDDSDRPGPKGNTDEETQSDMGLAAGGGTQADEGERVGTEDEETPPEKR